MHRCLIICAAFLTGCDRPERLIYTVPHVPADLRQPARVACLPGITEGALALCLLRKSAGLSRANAQLAAIDEILTAAESASR